MTARPDHPGIIPICGLSCDDDNGSPLLVKLAEGKTLRE